MIADRIITSTIASAAAIAPCIPDVAEVGWIAGGYVIGLVVAFIVGLVAIGIGEWIWRTFNRAWSCSGRRSADRQKS